MKLAQTILELDSQVDMETEEEVENLQNSENSIDLPLIPVDTIEEFIDFMKQKQLLSSKHMNFLLQKFTDSLFTLDVC